MKSIFAKIALVFGLGSTPSSYAATNNAIIVDVRTAQEFSEGHAKGAINIDVLQPDFKDRVSKLNKDNAVKVYCRSGNRSSKAAQIMKSNGFKDVENVGSLNQAIKKFGEDKKEGL